MARWILKGAILIFTAFRLPAVLDAQAAPTELMQYVRDAKKAGLKDSQIMMNAVKAGWTEAAVTDAMDAVRAAPKTQPSTTSVAASKPNKTEAASAALEPELAPATPPEKSPTPAAKPEEEPKASAPVETKPAPAAAAPKIPVDTRATAAAAAEAAGAIKQPVNRGVPDDYIIGAGDVLHVNVWKEPDASVASAVVRPDGKISMPLLKEVSVVGLTPKQVEKQIADQLAQFISGADVTIIVSGINSKKVYLAGAVKKEGPIPYTYQMTVMQALSEGGGLNDYAKRTRIYVLRNENGRQFRLPFDYNAVLKGEKVELNIILQPGDTVVVPH
jgi:polysaccharide export outer membrane protein